MQDEAPESPAEPEIAEVSAPDRLDGARKSALRAEDYRAKALQSALLAEGSDLPHVREKHAHAASAWRDLAEIEERPRTIWPPVGRSPSSKGRFAVRSKQKASPCV